MRLPCVGELWQAIGMPKENVFLLFVPDGTNADLSDLRDAKAWLESTGEVDCNVVRGWPGLYNKDGAHNFAVNWNLVRLVGRPLRDYVVSWSRAPVLAPGEVHPLVEGAD